MGKFQAILTVSHLVPKERELIDLCGWRLSDDSYTKTITADSITEFMRQIFFRLADGEELKLKIIVMLQKLDAYILESQKSDARYERDRLIQELLSSAVFIRRLVAMFGQELENQIKKENDG